MQLKIKNATKKGYLIAEEGDGIDTAYPESKTRRGRVQKTCHIQSQQMIVKGL